MPIIDTLDALCDVMTTILPTILTTNFAQDMPQIIDRPIRAKVCQIYAEDMPKIYQTYLQICTRYPLNMSKIFLKYAQICHMPRYTQDMSKIFPRYAKISKTLMAH